MLAVLGAVGAWDTIQAQFLPEAWQKYRVVSIMPSLPWYVWVIAGLVLLVFIVLEGAYREVQRRKSPLQAAPSGSIGIKDAGRRTRVIRSLFIGRGTGVQVDESASDHHSEGNIQVAVDSLQKASLPAGRRMSDAELDEECQRTKVQLLRFQGERELPRGEWPPSIPWDEYTAQMVRHYDETQRLYLDRFSAKVKWLLEELRSRGYYDDKIDIYNDTAFTSPHAIQETAIFLGAWWESRRRRQ